LKLLRSTNLKRLSAITQLLLVLLYTAPALAAEVVKCEDLKGTLLEYNGKVVEEQVGNAGTHLNFTFLIEEHKDSVKILVSVKKGFFDKRFKNIPEAERKKAELPHAKFKCPAPTAVFRVS